MAFRAVLPTVPNLSRAFGGPDSVLSWAKIELEIVTVKIKKATMNSLTGDIVAVNGQKV